MTFRELFESVSDGRMTIEQAEEYLSSYGFVELGYHRFDTHRERRTRKPEVVFGLGKTLEQLVEIVGYFAEKDLPILVTRVDGIKAAALAEQFPSLTYDPRSGIVRNGLSAAKLEGRVAILSAGSSDQPVAEEAAGTLEFFGVTIARAYDCGVAGLHRLFAAGGEIRDADVVIVVAGMDGALPSVVGGLFHAPVIAVPTSVGYGAAFDGLAALLSMLNSCAAGITVVNIDNGFGAAMAAKAILELASRKSTADSVRL